MGKSPGSGCGRACGGRELIIGSERLIGLAMVAVAAVASAQSLGCATPEQRHRLLTIFFDGVPPLRTEPTRRSSEFPDYAEASELPRFRSKGAIVSVHGPVSSKRCDLCHVSRYSNRLTDEIENLCWSCHEAEDFPGEVFHGPVAAGLCIGCHDPHRSRYPFLLLSSQAEICQKCHDDYSFSELALHRSEQGDDCISCHDPHAAGREYMLKRDAEPS